MNSRESISRLSRMLDTAVSFKSSTVHNEAYQRAMKNLEKAVEEEERHRKEMVTNVKLQERAEDQEKALKSALAQHHGMVLRQQLEEREAIRESQKREAQLPDINPMFHGYPNLPQTPFDARRDNQKQISNQVKSDLEIQMLDNERLREQRNREERLLDNFRAEMAKVSLEQDLKANREKKELERDILRQAWQEDMEMKRLAKNIERLENGLGFDSASKISTPASSIRGENHDHDSKSVMSQIESPVPEQQDETGSQDEDPVDDAATDISAAQSEAAPSVARSVASAEARQKQLAEVVAYSKANSRQQEIKSKISAARSEIEETMSKRSNRSYSQLSQRSVATKSQRSRLGSVGTASIFSASVTRSVRNGANTPSDRLRNKLAALDAKEAEINERKAKIKSMLNQELNKQQPGAPSSTTSSFLNQTLPAQASSRQQKSFYQHKVKPPSQLDRQRKRREVDKAVDTVSELIKGAFDKP